MDLVKQHAGTVGQFLDGLAKAETAHNENDRPGFAAAVTTIKTGATAMRKESEGQSRAWSARYRLQDLAKMRIALERFIATPSTALTTVSGRPIGYGTAQLWTDMAVEVVRGEWTEAHTRRKMSPAELVLFAVGPFGVLAAFAIHGGDAVPDVAKAVGLKDEYEEIEETLSDGMTGARDRMEQEKIDRGFVGDGSIMPIRNLCAWLQNNILWRTSKLCEKGVYLSLITKTFSISNMSVLVHPVKFPVST